MTDTQHAATKAMWAYAYQIVPPQPEARLASIKALLEQEQKLAKKGARTWEGRFVKEQAITHILVVSDSPDQAGEPNRRLEAALIALQAEFVRTAPLAVDDAELAPGGSKLPPMLAPLAGTPAADPKA